MTFADVRRTAPALLLLAATVWLAAGDKTVEAHGSEARYVEVAPWQRDRIPRVLAVSRSELGTPGTRRTMEVRDVEGRSCLVGALFALDVDDDYAFDIDESVTLTLTYATGLTTPFVVGWDRNGGEGVGVTAELAPEPRRRLREHHAHPRPRPLCWPRRPGHRPCRERAGRHRLV